MGRTPKQALREGISNSFDPVSVLNETGKPIAMFGVMSTSLVSGTGVPWFLGSDEVYRYPRDLLVTGEGVVAHWLTTFRKLENMVAVDNERAIRLLLKWGASFSDDIQIHRGVEFVSFTLQRKRAGG